MKLFKLSLKERKGDLTMAKKANSLAHTKWMCKYHIVFTPKYRRKAIYNQYREDLGDVNGKIKITKKVGLTITSYGNDRLPTGYLF